MRVLVRLSRYLSSLTLFSQYNTQSSMYSSVMPSWLMYNTNLIIFLLPSGHRRYSLAGLITPVSLITSMYALINSVDRFFIPLYAIMFHYNEIIIGAIATQITSLAIFYLTVYSDADQRKHQSSASLAFERGFHRFPAQMASNAENVSLWWRNHAMWTVNRLVLSIAFGIICAWSHETYRGYPLTSHIYVIYWWRCYQNRHVIVWHPHINEFIS